MQLDKKTIGTFKVEGMLEGPLPADGGDCEAKIKTWVAAARATGLTFSLDRSGGHFSLLADERLLQSSTFAAGAGLGEKLQSMFERLLEAFPVQMRMELFSTLRSTEYRPGSEVQTIYAVAPPGTIDSQERSVEADTVAPLPQLTSQGKRRIAVLGLFMLLLLGAIGFLVFKPQLKDAADSLTGLKVEDIKLELAGFEGFISVAMQKVDKSKGGLAVEVSEGELWTQLVADPAARIPADLEWNRLLAAQSLRRGYVRCELFDKDGKFLGSSELRLHDLLKADKQKVSAVIALPRGNRPAVIRLTF